MKKYYLGAAKIPVLQHVTCANPKLAVSFALKSRLPSLTFNAVCASDSKETCCEGGKIAADLKKQKRRFQERGLALTVNGSYSCKRARLKAQSGRANGPRQEHHVMIVSDLAHLTTPDYSHSPYRTQQSQPSNNLRSSVRCSFRFPMGVYTASLCSFPPVSHPPAIGRALPRESHTCFIAT
jgi:hypothetical protein